MTNQNCPTCKGLGGYPKCPVCQNRLVVNDEANDGWLARLVRLHAGRSWARLSIYLAVLLVLLPISLTLELLRDAFDGAAEWVNSLSGPLQKWAEFRKPNAKPHATDSAEK